MVARVIWADMLSIAVTYFITLCLFPGLESEIRHCVLGEWLPILIMAVFNLSDFVGKVGYPLGRALSREGGSRPPGPPGLPWGCPWGGQALHQGCGGSQVRRAEPSHVPTQAAALSVALVDPRPTLGSPVSWKPMQAPVPLGDGAPTAPGVPQRVRAP